MWPTLQVKVKLIVPSAGGISERSIESAAEVPPKLGECMLNALDHSISYGVEVLPGSGIEDPGLSMKRTLSRYLTSTMSM